MTLQSFIEQMPKVDLGVQLEGSLQLDSLLLIAQQNEIASTFKSVRQYEDAVERIRNPEFDKLDEIARESAAWLKYPEDITRAVYDLGLALAKQNVKYAEVSVIPAIYTDNGLTFETLLNALNDGRDRVLRGWNITLNWVMSIPTDRPRKADDIARWAISNAAQNGNVVGLGLVGRDDLHPVEQFRKAFVTAERKGLHRTVVAASHQTPDTLAETFDTLLPDRISDVWGIAEDSTALDLIREQAAAVVVSPIRELLAERISSVADYPLRRLYDEAIQVSLTSSMPERFGVSLTDLLLELGTAGAISPEELETLMLNSVAGSFLPDDAKTGLLTEFQSSFEELRKEHLVEG